MGATFQQIPPPRASVRRICPCHRLVVLSGAEPEAEIYQRFSVCRAGYRPVADLDLGFQLVRPPHLELQRSVWKRRGWTGAVGLDVRLVGDYPDRLRVQCRPGTLRGA